MTPFKRASPPERFIYGKSLPRQELHSSLVGQGLLRHMRSCRDPTVRKRQRPLGLSLSAVHILSGKAAVHPRKPTQKEPSKSNGRPQCHDNDHQYCLSHPEAHQPSCFGNHPHHSFLLTAVQRCRYHNNDWLDVNTYKKGCLGRGRNNVVALTREDEKEEMKGRRGEVLKYQLRVIIDEQNLIIQDLTPDHPFVKILPPTFLLFLLALI